MTTANMPAELSDLLAKHPGQQLCVECVEQMEAGDREPFEVAIAIGECVLCRGGACESHGQEYNAGFMHEACHELPDYTRVDDGQY